MAAAEPSWWDASGSRPERTQTEKSQPERVAAEKVAGLARKPTKVAGVANVAATSTGHKGRRCRFFRYIGCIEDHAAAACKEFRSLNKEAKKKP
jgi:hypothetical protein